MNLKQNFKYMNLKHKISRKVDKSTVVIENFNTVPSIIEETTRKKTSKNIEYLKNTTNST